MGADLLLPAAGAVHPRHDRRLHRDVEVGDLGVAGVALFEASQQRSCCRVRQAGSLAAPGGTSSPATSSGGGSAGAGSVLPGVQTRGPKAQTSPRRPPAQNPATGSRQVTVRRLRTRVPFRQSTEENACGAFFAGSPEVQPGVWPKNIPACARPHQRAASRPPVPTGRRRPPPVDHPHVTPPGTTPHRHRGPVDHLAIGAVRKQRSACRRLGAALPGPGPCPEKPPNNATPLVPGRRPLASESAHRSWGIARLADRTPRPRPPSPPPGSGPRAARASPSSAHQLKQGVVYRRAAGAVRTRTRPASAAAVAAAAPRRRGDRGWLPISRVHQVETIFRRDSSAPARVEVATRPPAGLLFTHQQDRRHRR